MIFETDTLPKEIRDAVLPILEEFAWLFPLWMQRVSVVYEWANTDATAQLHLQKDYRWATLTICPAYLAAKDQREVLVHEICHCYTIPMKTACVDIIEDSIENEKLKDIAYRNVNKAMESSTQDMAYAIARRFEF